MKNIFSLFVLQFCLLIALAQSPDAMSYQTEIRDANNNLLANHAVGIKISILQGSAEGSAIYAETQNPTTNVNGLLSLDIGLGTSDEDFSAIDWSSGPYFIKTEIDLNGGVNYTISGTSQLLSVPFAMYAKTAENVINGNNQTLSVSSTGDTLYLSQGNYVIIPGISYENRAEDISSQISDNNGNTYNSVLIGNQVWMAENLRASAYNDGSSIPQVTDGNEWSNLTTSAWCWYNNDSVSYDSLYGKLYNYYTVADTNSKNICPVGWHVPGLIDQTILINFIASKGFNINNAGDALKSDSDWDPSTENGIDEFDFNGQPGGYRWNDGAFWDIGRKGFFWLSDERSQSNGYTFELYGQDFNIEGNQAKEIGVSVRCVKD